HRMENEVEGFARHDDRPCQLRMRTFSLPRRIPRTRANAEKREDRCVPRHPRPLSIGTERGVWWRRWRILTTVGVCHTGASRGAPTAYPVTYCGRLRADHPRRVAIRRSCRAMIALYSAVRAGSGVYTRGKAADAGDAPVWKRTTPQMVASPL